MCGTRDGTRKEIVSTHPVPFGLEANRSGSWCRCIEQYLVCVLERSIWWTTSIKMDSTTRGIIFAAAKATRIKRMLKSEPITHLDSEGYTGENNIEEGG